MKYYLSFYTVILILISGTYPNKAFEILKYLDYNYKY